VKGQRIVIAGGNGFLGQHLAAAWLAAGCEVDILTRMPNPMKVGTQNRWDGASVDGWEHLLENADAIVNVTGKSVNCRYTPANRREIVESRVRSVACIGKAIAVCPSPPRVWVQASSLAIYGNPGDRLCDETAPPGAGFSPDACKQWERAFTRLHLPETRAVVLRMGLALGANGGALRTLARLARLGLGGTVGNGMQYVSWLHIADLERIVQHSLDQDTVTGIYNVTGPVPVRNAEFMSTLRRVLRRPWSPPVPAPAVRVGAWLMRTEPELALGGRRCFPRRLADEGFEFRFPQLEAALSDVLATR
jgi:uncharacterized protein